MIPRRSPVIMFLVLATVMKFGVAAVVGGTADIPQQLQQAQRYMARSDLLDPTVSNPASFLIGHYVVVTTALMISEVTKTAFAFWVKTPAILTDLGVSFLLLRLPQGGSRVAVAYMANPVTLLLSVYHGQIHTVAAGLATFALWLWQRDRSVLGGLVLGLAASVRQHFAMLLVPAIRQAKNSRLALLIFGCVVLVINAPLLGSAHLHRMLNPPSAYGLWGYGIPLLQGPRVLALAGVDGGFLVSINRIVAAYGAALYWAWALVFALWVWRRPRIDVWHAALLFLVGFYAISPGFGVQWLVWALPFWLIVNYRGALVYSALAGSYLAGSYWVWKFNAKYGVGSITANLDILTRIDLFLYLSVGALGFITWAYCVRAAWRLARA